MNWKEAALVHAKDQDPKESCGLLLNIKGKEKYFPCRNLSMTAFQCFIIDPEDYIKADNTGDIIAVVAATLKPIFWIALQQAQQGGAQLQLRFRSGHLGRVGRLVQG